MLMLMLMISIETMVRRPGSSCSRLLGLTSTLFDSPGARARCHCPGSGPWVLGLTANTTSMSTHACRWGLTWP